MFKPNLLQISNSGYMAFKEAHVKMDVIRQDTERIPNGMKEIVLILVKGDKATLETALPIALRNIEDIAQNCLQCAEVNIYYNLDKNKYLKHSMNIFRVFKRSLISLRRRFLN